MNYSAISTYYACPRKYKLEYIDKISIPGLESGDLHFGSAMHAGLQSSLEGNEGTPVFNIYWDSIKNKDIVYSRFNWVGLQHLGRVFIQRFERLHKKHFEAVSIEERLYGQVSTHKMEGTPDVIGKYKGTPSVIDFKTSKDAYRKEKILVNEQMPIYAHLAKQQLAYEVKQLVYYVFVKSEERVQVVLLPLTKEFMDAMLDNVKRICDEMQSRQHFPMNRNSCVMGSYLCPYFNVCYKQTKENDNEEIS